MSDWVFAAALIAAQPVAWLLAWLITRVLPLKSAAVAEWKSVEKELSPRDRLRVRRAVDRGQAPDDPRLRSYAATYARSRLALLRQVRKNRMSWLVGLALVVLLHGAIAIWLTTRDEWVAAIAVAGLIALVVAVGLISARRRPAILQRAVEANTVG